MSTITGFLFGTIPWEFWLAAGMIATGALAILVPTRLGMLGAGIVFALTCTTAAYSRGEHAGIAAENSRWEAEVETQKQALRAEFATQLSQEQARTAEALAETTKLTQERDNAIQLAARDPNAGDVALPEYLVDSLCDLAPRGCQGDPSRQGGGSPSRPRTLRGLLQRLRAPPPP